MDSKVLLNSIKDVKKKKEDEVKRRIRELKQNLCCKERMFIELAFCILTANFNAERSIRIQESINTGFLILPQEELSRRLRSLGHRYPNTRATYIVQARKKLDFLWDLLKSNRCGKDIREIIYKEIKGLGWKESSHFLRNVGFMDVSIIDYHIVDLLLKYDLLNERPLLYSKKNYLYVEKILEDISKKMGIPLGELDLYLWYMETGKILK